MIVPAITKENFRDFRTPDGNRVTGFKATPLHPHPYLTFERPWKFDRYSVESIGWYVDRNSLQIPASSPSVRLVYDPITTMTPPQDTAGRPPFWLVWNPQGRSVPSFRHPSEASAVREAERLSALVPGNEFYVLKATSKSTTGKPQVQTGFFA